jgi:hypothetical protein
MNTQVRFAESGLPFSADMLIFTSFTGGEPR